MRERDQHYGWIDSLRGLGAMGVALFHFTQPAPHADDWYQFVSQYLAAGVVAFFVLSGFVVQLSAARSEKVGAFLSKRFWRIYPAYLASVLVIVALAVTRKALTGTNDIAPMPHGFGDVMAILTLTTSPVSAAPAMNWVYWTLSYEVAFYLLLCIGIVFKPARQASVIIISLAALLTPPAIATATIAGVRPLFFLDHWSAFALGIAFAEALRSNKAFAAAVALLAVADLVIVRGLPESAYALLTIGTISLSFTRYGAWLNRRRITAAVGKWSYSLYLLHVPIGVFLFAPVFDRMRHAGGLPHMCADLILLAICVAISAVAWRLVESPGSKLWKKFQRAPAPRPELVTEI